MRIVHPVTSLARSISTNPGVYVPLIGSGMSVAAGVPTGHQLVEMLAREVIRSEAGNSPEDVNQWWNENRGAPLTYQSMVQALALGAGDRQALLKAFIEPTAEELTQGLKAPTRAHLAVADLVKCGSVKIIMTTNFDRLVESALTRVGIQPQVLTEPSDVDSMIPLQHARCTVIKLHGDYQRANLLNTDDELDSYPDPWHRLLARVLDEYGLFTVGWSGQSDAALRRAVLDSSDRLYGRYFGIGGSHMHDDLMQYVADGHAQVIELDDAERFFDQLGGAVDELAKREPAPLDTPALLGATKRLLASDHGVIPLRDLLLREAGLLKARIDQWWADVTGRPHDYREAIDQLGTKAEPLVASVACGAYLGSSEHRHLWIDTLRVVADQPPCISGAMWMQDLAIRRLPSYLLFMGALLGAWKREDLDLVVALCREEILHSYVHALSQHDLQTIGPRPAPMAVSLAAPDIVEAGAIGQLVASNVTYPPLAVALTDLYPVKLDLARDFEDIEYLLAMVQDDWHAQHEAPAHERWDFGHFYSGLLKLPGATTVLRETASNRFARRAGPIGFDSLSLSGLFGHSPERARDARRRVDAQLYDDG